MQSLRQSLKKYCDHVFFYVFFSKFRAALSYSTERKQREDADNSVGRSWEQSTLVLFYASENYQHKLSAVEINFFFLFIM